MEKIKNVRTDRFNMNQEAIEEILNSCTRKAYVSAGYNRCPVNIRGILLANVDRSEMSIAGAAELDNTKIYKSFLKDEDIKYLAKITARARSVIEKYQISEHLVPNACWEEIEDRFYECKADFEERIDKIVLEWDDRLTDFESANMEMLRGIKMPEELRFRLIKEIMQSIPTKRAFKESAYMMLSSGDKDVYSMALGVIRYSIAKAFEPIKTALMSIEQKGKVMPSSLASLNRYSNVMEKGNVFGNSLITSLADNLREVGKEQDTDIRYEILKDSFMDCYEYALETGFSLPLNNCPFSEKQISNFRAERKLSIAL